MALGAGTPKAGRVTDLYYDVAGGSTYVKMWAMRSANFQGQWQMLDTTDHDSGTATESIPGRYSWSIDVEAVYEEAVTPADTSYDSIYEAWRAGTSVNWQWRPIGTANGNDAYTGLGYVTSLTMNSPNDDIITYSFTIQGTSTITQSDQT